MQQFWRTMQVYMVLTQWCARPWLISSCDRFLCFGQQWGWFKMESNWRANSNLLAITLLQEKTCGDDLLKWWLGDGNKIPCWQGITLRHLPLPKSLKGCAAHFYILITSSDLEKYTILRYWIDSGFFRLLYNHFPSLAFKPNLFTAENTVKPPGRSDTYFFVICNVIHYPLCTRFCAVWTQSYVFKLMRTYSKLFFLSILSEKSLGMSFGSLCKVELIVTLRSPL